MYLNVNRALDWRPPSDWKEVTTLDLHTGGEPFRILLADLPELAKGTILERRRKAKQEFDSLRRTLMWEPRGHADMYGGLLLPPATDDGDFGILFLHNEGFSTMCGHGIIAATHAVAATGMVEPEQAEKGLRIDAPAGRIVARVDPASGDVRFRNVPSFVLGLDRQVSVPGIGEVTYDLAFGGAFYAFVDAASVDLACGPDRFRDLVDCGIRIKQAVIAADPPKHPDDDDLSFLYGVIFVEPSDKPGVHSRNVCIFADGEVDRSPTGTGVSARVAIHAARGELKEGESLVIESIVGSVFKATHAGAASAGNIQAVIPEVAGQAWITGRNRFWVDPADPFAEGFLLR